jgi:hypothetical protein
MELKPSANPPGPANRSITRTLIPSSVQLPEQAVKPGSQTLLIAGFAFPDNYRFPSKLQGFFSVFFIACYIILKFFLPFFSIAGGDTGKPASFMAMPETSVNVNQGFIAGQHYIG